MKRRVRNNDVFEYVREGRAHPLDIVGVCPDRGTLQLTDRRVGHKGRGIVRFESEYALFFLMDIEEPNAADLLESLGVSTVGLGWIIGQKRAWRDSVYEGKDPSSGFNKNEKAWRVWNSMYEAGYTPGSF